MREASRHMELSAIAGPARPAVHRPTSLRLPARLSQFPSQLPVHSGPPGLEPATADTAPSPLSCGAGHTLL